MAKTKKEKQGSISLIANYLEKRIPLSQGNPLEPNSSSQFHMEDYLRGLIFANVTFINIEDSDSKGARFDFSKMLLPYLFFFF